LLHCEQRGVRQKEAAGLADENEHGKFSSRIKLAVDATNAKAKEFADEAEWVFGRRAARVLGVVALFAVVVALLLVFVDWYVAPNKPSERKDLLVTEETERLYGEVSGGAFPLYSEPVPNEEEFKARVERHRRLADVLLA
jgi:hypothetical protein